MTLKVAIIGTGNVASRNYLPFLAQQEDVVLSYYNRTREKADTCARQFGGWVADSIDELMGELPDMVMLLTSEMARYELATEVLQYQPKHIFFEKPLVAQQGQAHVTEDDFEKGRELLRTAKANGTETAMVFNYRFFDQTLKARRLVEERQFGALIHSTGLVHYACWSHSIDLIHYFGGPVAEMTALSGPAEREHPTSNMKAHDVTAAFTLAERRCRDDSWHNRHQLRFPAI